MMNFLLENDLYSSKQTLEPVNNVPLKTLKVIVLGMPSFSYWTRHNLLENSNENHTVQLHKHLIQVFAAKTVVELNNHIEQQKPDVILADFTQKPDTLPLAKQSMVIEYLQSMPVPVALLIDQDQYDFGVQAIHHGLSHVLHKETISLPQLELSLISMGYGPAQQVKKLGNADNYMRGMAKQYYKAFQHLEVGLALCSSKGNWLEVNPAFRRLTGYTSADLDLKNFGELVFSSHRERWAQIEELITTQKAISQQADLQLIRANGQLTWVHMAASVLHYDAQNKEYWMALSIADISERKATEEALMDTNAELDTFVYRASHDLKSPLNSIMGLIQVAYLEKEPQKAYSYLEMISKTAIRMESILKALLLSAKIKHASTEVTPISIDKLINDIKQSLCKMDGFEQVKLSTHYNKELHVEADLLLLNTVLQNLLENAIKYRNTKSHRCYVKLEIVEKEQGITIIIEDNGLGIDENLHSKVFDMFYRGTEASKGSGLGLYIVRNAVKKLKGEIQLISTQGVGTTFHVFLPSVKKVQGPKLRALEA